MDSAELAKLIQELEDRVERLRALYEQYFMGIERLEPLILRKDVDRRLWMLRREQIRNTATRFKLQTVVQRYNTYQQYWQRIVREIENGTYQRDLGRAAQRFGEAATTALGSRRQKMFEKGQARRAERDAKRQGSNPPNTSPSQKPESSPLASDAPLGEQDVLAIDDADMFEDDSAPPRPPVAPTLPRPPVKLPPRPDSGRPNGHASPAKPSKPPLGERHPLAPRASVRPAPPTSSVAGAAATPATRPGPRVAPPRAPAASSAAIVAAAASPLVALPPPSPAATVAAKPPRPPVPSPPAAPSPKAASPQAAAEVKPNGSPAASPGDDGGLSGARLRQIYGAYVDAKRQANESTAAITYDKIASNLRETAKQLREKHQGRAVDFEVVMKNGKPVLKPVLKA